MYTITIDNIRFQVLFDIYIYKLTIKQYKVLEDNDDQIEFNVIEEIRK